MKIKKARLILILLSVSTLVLAPLHFADQQTAGELFEKALYLEEAQGDLQKAVDLYRDIIKHFPENRQISAKAILHIGFCYEKLGLKQAQDAYQQVVDDFPEQKEAVKVAREKLSYIEKIEAMELPESKDLSMRKIRSGGGSVSPDGRYIARSNYSTGNLTIYDADSGKQRELDLGGNTKEPPFETIAFHAWSADGSSLVYSWSVNMKHELRVVAFEGGEPQTLYKSEKLTYIVPMDWSQDGNYILIAGSGPDISAGVGIYSVKNKTLEILEIPYKTAQYTLDDVVGFFSPDGKSILCTITVDGKPSKKDIYLYSISQKQMIPLIDSPANDVALGCTRDGADLIFTSDRTGTTDLWLSRLDSGRATREPLLLKRDIGLIYPLRISRDGAFFYSLRTGFVDVYVGEIDLDRNDSLANPRRIADKYQGGNGNPAWSPDGERLLYISERDYKGRRNPRSAVVCMHSLKDGTTKEIKPELTFIQEGIWFPDGKKLLIVGGDVARIYGLHKVDPDSGLTSSFYEYHDGTRITSPVFTKDGKKLFFRTFKWHQVYTVRNYKIRSYDLESKQEAILFTTNPETASYIYELELSPDEKTISFFTQSLKPICTILYTMSAQGGEPTEVLRVNPPEAIVDHSWDPGGQSLVLVIENRKTKEAKFQKISLKSGQIQSLGSITDWPGRFSLHPNGKSIAYTAGAGQLEIWVMENFLPDNRLPE